jgi:hypothetical protein
MVINGTSEETLTSTLEHRCGDIFDEQGLSDTQQGIGTSSAMYDQCMRWVSGSNGWPGLYRAIRHQLTANPSIAHDPFLLDTSRICNTPASYTHDHTVDWCNNNLVPVQESFESSAFPSMFAVATDNGLESAVITDHEVCGIQTTIPID